MPEIRKLIRLTKRCFAVTVPSKYIKPLGFQFGDYVEVSMSDLKTLAIRRHLPPEKQ